MRGYSNYKNAQSVSLSERLIAALTYVSTGIIGFIWIILAQIAGKRLKPFLRFHIYQSIFLALLYMVISILLKIMLAVGVKIPFIGSFIYLLYFYIFDFKIGPIGVSLVDFIVLVILAYLVITSLLGKESNLPKVSDMIRKLM